MTAATVLARERRVRPRHEPIDQRLRRFAWRHREALSGLARRHPRLADLVLSFPALLFALAVPRPRFDPELVIERVIAGAPLAELAAASDIPMWTRKLMPEAFLFPIPRLPDGDVFRHQIANHFPEAPREAHAWLRLVADAAYWGSEAIALWFARHAGQASEAKAMRQWRLICLWAWHASNPAAVASRYLRVRWTPEMAPKQAYEAALDWTLSVLSAADLGNRQIADPWGEPAMLDGYVFEPILNADQLVAAATVMRNCIRTYSCDMAEDTSRFWLLRKAGETDAPAAMLALNITSENAYPTLGEISGPANLPPPADAVLAIHRWHRMYVPLERVEPALVLEVPPENWRRLWRDYWLARQRIPEWLGLRYDWRKWNLLKDVDWNHPARRRARRRRR